MYDVALYGHITVDRVFDGFEESTSLGAIANSWDALMQIDPNLSVKLKPTSYGEAIILVDKEKNFRLGRPRLSLKTNKNLKVEMAKWHHIMYLNSIDDVSFISNLKSGIISADITVGNKKKNLDYLKFIDFLFISDEDLFMDLEELSAMVRGCVILHSPTGSTCTNINGDVVHEHKAKIVNGLNVLGAGDIFASAFIFSSLSTKNNIKKNIEFAHEETLKLLLEKSSNEL